MGFERVSTSKAMVTAEEVCRRGKGRGRAAGEGPCCGGAASTGTATKEGMYHGSVRRREAYTSIRKLDTKALEHISAPTKSVPSEACEPRTQGQVQGRARLEEGEPHIRGCTTGVGVRQGGVGVQGGRYSHPSTRGQATLLGCFPTTRDITKGDLEGEGAGTNSTKVYPGPKAFCRHDAQVQADNWGRD